MFTHKSPHLPASQYLGTKSYFVTICCHAHHHLFQTQQQGVWILKFLTASAHQYNFLLHAYSILPNHLHVLVEGKHQSCDLLKFVSYFKQKTGYVYKQKTRRPLWQPRFYDHILRHPRDFEPIALYIWLNPIRKNLCTIPQDYPLSGSQTVDWKARCSTPQPSWNPPWKTSTTAPTKPQRNEILSTKSS